MTELLFFIGILVMLGVENSYIGIPVGAIMLIAALVIHEWKQRND